MCKYNYEWNAMLCLNLSNYTQEHIYFSSTYYYIQL